MVKAQVLNISRLGRLALVALALSGVTACGVEQRGLSEQILAGGGTIAEDDNFLSDRGTVFKSELEGGFYFIRGIEGHLYTPTNLPAELQVDGLVVDFEATVEREAVSFTMVGELITLGDYSVVR